MILGILGVIYAFSSFSMIIMFSGADYDFYNFIMKSMLSAIIGYSIASVLAVVFGVCAVNRGYKNGISVSGLITGGLGVMAYLAEIIIILSI